MFQLPILRVMQAVVMLVALVSISSVCRAETVTVDDWKYNYTLDTEFRLVVETWDGTQLLYHVYGGQFEYEYEGYDDSNEYYTIYKWHNANIHNIPNEAISQAWVESRVNGFGDWYYQGTPAYTVEP